MADLQLQTLRAALQELQGGIKSDAGPEAQKTIQLLSTLIANAIARSEVKGSVNDIQEELQLQRDIINKEHKLIVDASIPSDQADLSEEALTEYIRKNISGNPTVINARKLVGGASKQTIILNLEVADKVNNTLVLRRDLASGPVESQAADEFSITKQLYARGLAVADPVWADRSPPFGGTCMVTHLVSGEQAMDMTESGQKDGRREASLALARVLGSIHSVPISELEMPDKNLSTSLRERTLAMLAVYEDQWKRRRVDTSPTIVKALAWLRENVPEGGRPALVHGDASLRNLMMNNGSESAMLDWELWHVGDHNEDIAYCQADITPRLDWNEFLAEYYRHGGTEIDLKAIKFWGMFGAIRNIIFASALAHSYATDEHPHVAAMYMALAGGRPLTKMVAQQLENL